MPPRRKPLDPAVLRPRHLPVCDAEHDQTVLAYLAGLFDGEGSVSIARASKPDCRLCYSLAVAITNTYLPAIEFLVDTLGGSAYVSNKKRGNGTRPCHEWRAGGARAARFLSLVRPYLRIKWAQVDVAIAYHREHHGPRNRWSPLTREELARRDALKQAISDINTGKGAWLLRGTSHKEIHDDRGRIQTLLTSLLQSGPSSSPVVVRLPEETGF